MAPSAPRHAFDRETPPARPPGMNAWRVRFTARILAFAAVAEVPPAVALTGWLRRAGVAPRALAPWLVVLALLAWNLILVRKLFDWQDDRRAPAARVWLLEVPYYVFGSACFAALPLGWLSLLGLTLAGLAGLAAPSTAGVLGALYLASLGWALWGSTAGRVFPRVHTHRVTLPGLDPKFNGFRIVQLSDVHHGPYLPRWLYALWARRVGALRPDLVALTGDLITSGVGYLDDVADFAERLRAHARVVACMGNHDYFGTTVGVPNALAHVDATLLRNEGLALERDGARLWIAALDDRWSRRDDLERALRDRPDGAPVILLAHDPSSFPEIAERDVALTLSGHTHGGQFALPVAARTFNLARLTTRFTAGFFSLGGSKLYVNRGIGTSGPPTRLGVPPEITLFVLQSPHRSSNGTE